MKRVLLFRHGKSDWNQEYDADRDRPLNARGTAAAGRMGLYLAELGQVPDLAISSTALRARETVRLAREAGGWPCEIELTPELYEASVDDVLGLIRRCDEAHSSVLLAGHEPTLSLLGGTLIGNAWLKFPTAAMARIDCDVSRWMEISAGRGRLAWLVTPKLLARAGGGAALSRSPE